VKAESFLTLLLPLLLVTPVHSEPKLLFDEKLLDLLSVESKIRSILPVIKSAVVSIESSDGAGSGVIVSEDGLVLTAAHVIGKRGEKMMVTLAGGGKKNAVSKGGSELSDAGMLQLEKNERYPYVPLAKQGSSAPGQWCLALGHPNGFNQERGMVLRAGMILEKKDETLQTNCRLLGGDSGGPLFNLRGEVIGIHSRISKNSDENYHTTIESFLSNWNYFLSEEILLLKNIQSAGFLGVMCEQSKRGLRIMEVIPHSEADQMGLLANDELLRLDSIPLDTREKLTILISEKSPGEIVTLDFMRGSREIAVQIQLGSRE
jgi:serine protease Do